MPLPSTFAAASARAEGEFTKVSSGPPPIGGPYWWDIKQDRFSVPYVQGGAGPYDQSFFVEVDSNGNTFEIGQVFAYGNNPTNITITKRNSSGTVLWEASFNDQGSAASSFTLPLGSCLDSSGNIYVLYNDINGWPNRVYVLKLNGTDGTKNFEINFQGSSGTVTGGISSMCIDSNDNIYVSIEPTSGDTILNIFKINTSGATIASTSFTTLTVSSLCNVMNWNQYPTRNLKIGPDGYLYYAGRRHFTTIFYPIVIKMDTNLVQQWTYELQSSGSNAGNWPLSIEIDNTGNVYIAGIRYSGSVGAYAAKLVPGTVDRTSSGASSVTSDGSWLTHYTLGSTTPGANSAIRRLKFNSTYSDLIAVGSFNVSTTGANSVGFALNISTSNGSTLNRIGTLRGGVDYNAGAMATSIADVQFDRSDNLYLVGAINSNNYGAIAFGKSTSYINWDNSFIIKDIKDFANTHNANANTGQDTQIPFNWYYNGLHGTPSTTNIVTALQPVLWKYYPSNQWNTSAPTAINNSTASASTFNDGTSLIHYYGTM